MLVPLHWSSVQGFPSSAHGLPAGLNWQVEEQQSLAVPLFAPSSHCSPTSTTPLPQTAGTVVVVVEVVVVVAEGL